MPQRRAPRSRRPIPETYRRILVSTIWSQLATLAERARNLWLRLALAEEVTPIPGLVLIRADELAIALTAPASAPWSADEVERVAASIPAAMLRADWRAGVVWLPPVFRWHPPASPKNVAAWRRPWAEMPASPLASEIHDELRLACAGRGAGFVRAFAELAPPAAVAVLAPASAAIQISGVDGGVVVTASGIPEHAGPAVVLELARRLGVSITITAAEIVDAPAAVVEQPALVGLADYTAPSQQRGRRTKSQAALEDRSADIERVIAYQRDRRAAAFELAQRQPVEIDEAECRKAIAALMAGGATMVELETAIDRQYEKIGRASPGQRKAEAGWWTHLVWGPAKFRSLLALQVGAEPPATAGKLAKLVNEVAPPGADQLRPLAEMELRPLAQLLVLRPDASAILVAATTLAAVVVEQERQLRHRPLVEGEARLVKLWGGPMFRTAVWSGIQTVVERWPAADEAGRLDCFRSLSLAMRGEAASANSAHIG